MVREFGGKFEVGDKVRFSSRYPSKEYKHRTRTVVEVRYDKIAQANFYRLGDNYRSNGISQLFRSYELVKAKNLHMMGRPKKQRTYKKWWLGRNKLASKVPAASVFDENQPVDDKVGILLRPVAKRIVKEPSDKRQYIWRNGQCREI